MFRVRKPVRRTGDMMKMACRISLTLAFTILSVGGCRGEDGHRKEARADTVLIVLGNEPLDDLTPTVDTVARVHKAVEFQKEHPGTLLVFTGGPTAGTNTEARMMAALAVTQGCSTNSILLEERARSTQENARLTAELMQRLKPQHIFIVSKSDHLDWAMLTFKQIDVFKAAEPLACKVSRADSIAQMEKYLETHDNARVRERLQRLKDGVRGTD